jgi:ATP-binding cassette subfamily B protein
MSAQTDAGEAALAIGSLRDAVAQRLRPDRLRLVASLVVLVVYTASTLAGPFLIGYAIDHGLGPHDLSVLTTVSVIFLVAALLAAGASRLQIRLVGTIGESFLYRLRIEAFEHLQALPLGFYDSERTGRLVARMTADFDAMESLMQQGLIVLVSSMLVFGTVLVLLVVLSWQLFLICLLVVPALYFPSRRFSRDSRRAYLEVRERIGSTMVTVEEGITGVKVVQAFAREDQQVGRFARRNAAQLEANLAAVRVGVRYFPVVEGSSVITVGAMLGIGGLLVEQHLVLLGTVVSFILYLNSIFDPLQQMSNLFNQVQQAAAALRKILGVLAVEPSLTEAPDPIELPPGGELRIERLGFSYSPGSPKVLSGVDLVIARGERLALVGPTGAGKSTLAKLIARCYDPTEGCVRYGGVDLRQASFASLRRRIVMLPQEGFLLRGSIVDNVRLARPDASDGDVRRAIEALGVLERFEAMPGGLDAVIEGRGARLSAGERQLISLARAALAAPDVLVLDEVTSSLDPGTEAAVEHAMHAVTSGRTTIVIAHRLTTARNADRVAVVSDGGIAEIGSHDELVARGGRYAALYGAWDLAGEGGLAAAG